MDRPVPLLTRVLANVGTEPSAHEATEQEQQRWSSIPQLAAEYETIAATAQHDRWTALIERSGLESAEVDAILISDAFPALTAQLRLAEANHPTSTSSSHAW